MNLLPETDFSIRSAIVSQNKIPTKDEIKGVTINGLVNPAISSIVSNATSYAVGKYMVRIILKTSNAKRIAIFPPPSRDACFLSRWSRYIMPNSRNGKKKKTLRGNKNQ